MGEKEESNYETLSVKPHTKDRFLLNKHHRQSIDSFLNTLLTLHESTTPEDRDLILGRTVR